MTYNYARKTNFCEELISFSYPLITKKLSFYGVQLVIEISEVLYIEYSC
jgi:hypothetical protein